MPLTPTKPSPSYPGDTSGEVIVNKFSNAGCAAVPRAGRVLLTHQSMEDPITINPSVTYNKKRVRKFMDHAGITPERWIEL